LVQFVIAMIGTNLRDATNSAQASGARLKHSPHIHRDHESQQWLHPSSQKGAMTFFQR
jgi:hypothetical protein